MTNTKKITLLTAILATTFGLVILNQNKSLVTNYVASAVPELPGPTAPINAPETSEDSPDGSVSLTMKKMANKDQTIYSFYTDKLIFTKTLDGENSMSIPLNAWSPNNKYFFVKENIGGTTNYYVFTASGDPFKNNQEYLSPADVFAKKYPDLKLTEITGWASNTLLILNADKSTGEQGPSFWFDLGSQSIIQLSRRFN